MANRLTKLAEARYTPAVPAQPAVLGRCIQENYDIPGYYSYTEKWILQPDGQYYILRTANGYTPPSVGSRTVCYPAQPYIPAQPAVVYYTAVNGWNGAARSIDQLDVDGYVEFQASSGTSATVVGFSKTDLTPLPSEQTHALYIHGSTVDVFERGVIVHTASVSHTYANVYRIERRGLTITYSCDAWSYTSGAPSRGAVFLDASIYGSTDFIDNPELTVLENTGTAAGTLGALIGRGYEGVYADAFGTLGALTGEAGVLELSTASGSLRAMAGVGADYPYTYAEGSLSPMDGSGDGGYPQVSIIYGVGLMPALVGVATGFTGTVGSVDAPLPAMAGLAADRPYGEMSGSLQALQGYAVDDWGVANAKRVSEVLLLGDSYFPANVASAAWNEDLELQDEFVYNVSIDDVIYDALALADALTVEQAIEVLLESSLLLGNDLSGSLRLELPGGITAGEPLQYAVNVLTGAITTYSGFGFSSFARCGQELYGCKGTGVYRVRRGDDDGALIQGHIDFGTTDFGSTGIKSVETVYLGVATDGQIVARLVADDGDERQYRVVQRGPIMRAVTAKGVGGRMWNVALEIIDASEFELDVLEVQLGISRRWGSR